MRSRALCILLLWTATALLGAKPFAPACGNPGAKPCPLQAFMRDELARPYAERHLDELGANLNQLAAFNPDPAGWRDWAQLAADAARAARAHGDAETLKACSRCHRRYRAEYLQRFRARALPGAHD